MPKRTCSQCLFFDAHERDIIGKCHRNAPGRGDSPFPSVDRRAWCGSFKPAQGESDGKLLRVAEVIAGGLAANPSYYNALTARDDRDMIIEDSIAIARGLIDACEKVPDASRSET